MSLEDILRRSPIYYDFQGVAPRMKAPRNCGSELAEVMADCRNECKDILIEVEELKELIKETLLRIENKRGSEEVNIPRRGREPSEEQNS